MLFRSSSAFLDYTARANHSGTQLAATISDFDTQVRTNRLDQLTAPTADVSINSHKLTSVTDPTSAQDASTKAYTDSAAAGIDAKVVFVDAPTGNRDLKVEIEGGPAVGIGVGQVGGADAGSMIQLKRGLAVSMPAGSRR